MARIRSIKPEFWIDEKIVELSPWARLLFIALWNFADDQGYVDNKPKRIKMQAFPGDAVEVEPLIGELISRGLLQEFESPIGDLLRVANWERHQRVDKPAKPRVNPDELTRRLPRPLPEPSTSPREDSPAEGKGEEGKGREVPPTAGREAPRDQGQKPPPADRDATAQSLIAEWLDHVPKRPPGAVIGQIGKLLRNMLDEGIAPPDVRRGLAEWARKGLHPSTLPSVVNEVMNRGPSGHAAWTNPSDQSVYDEAL